ncbi:MAG: hypothetical protein IJ337_07210 [Clostridia bacterium]|nr:hypothetical protein [Clostridia bacterium]
MRMTLKRLTAWMLTLMMIFSCVSASAVDGNVVDYSDSTSAYDVMPQDDSASESITVTFVINNSDYTNDPGSQTTHITAKAPIEGGGLTYTKWAGRYKVTGTGTVCSYSIPAGTSLSDRGYALPALSVENIGNTNTYSYSSLKTWVTADGMVCSADTDFEADTTLYLQLFESGSDIYSLDFVCSTDNHSIKSVGNFLLGQSVSQAHIDAATEAANAFESQWCSYGPASNQRLQKWQLKKTATGEMVDLSAGMAITEEYVNSQYGTAVKVYAVWEENTSTPVTATFQYDVTVDGTTTTQTADTRTLNAGDALGELPDMTAHTPEGSTFIGWQYTAEDGSLQYATAETVITADTVFTAVFGMQVTATFQYISSYDEETGEPVYETIAVRTLNAGDALGELPDMTAYNTPYETFESWQYTDAEGNEQTATAETIIMEDTVYTAVFAEVQCGIVVLHDIQPDGTDSDLVWDFSVPEGMTLDEAIEDNDADVEEGKLLSECIWRTAVNGELADMNAVVVADSEIHLYTHTYKIVLTLNLNDAPPAAFTAKARASVDTDPTEDGTITMTITAREGEKLTENDFIVNGTDLTQYAWTDGSGNAINLRSLIDEGVTGSITATSDGTPVSTDVTLSLTLTLDGTTKTYTITKPEGYILTAEDFVIEGLDLTVFTWTDASGTKVELADLVGTAISENTLTSDGSLDSGLVEGSLDVNFYVYIDNEPVRIASKTVTTYKQSNSNRRYLSAATLASVYGKYGFEASQLTVGTHYFPHVDAGGSTLWCDTAVLPSNGMYFSPITNGGVADVYYLPAQSITGTGENRNEAIVEANTFYTVTVEDPAGKVYTNDTLPERTITFTGGNTSMTVKKADGVTWSCVGQETGTTVNNAVDNGDGTITFNINGIAEPYIISASFDDVVVAQYDLALPAAPADEDYGRPLVKGEEEYSDVLEIADANEYTVLAPNPSSYFYKSGKYLGQALFIGWAVNGDTSNIVQPGAELDLSSYQGRVVRLVAQWDTNYGAATASSMVNFFVALNAVSEGTTAWQGNTDQSQFTQSVYTSDCGVTGNAVMNSDPHLYTGTITVGEETHYYVLGETDGDDLNARHNTIVNSLTAGYTKEGVTFQCSFPSDETVL